MKLLTASVIFSILSIEFGKTSAQSCGDPRDAVPFYRSDVPGPEADHYYTTNSTNIQQSIGLGYVPNGIAGWVFQTAQPGTVPFRRLFSYARGDHIYTTSTSERDNAVQDLGYIDEIVAGYVYPNATCGGLPLYIAYNPHVYAHIYTLSQAERDDAIQNLGYSDSGISAYIFPY